ncbi:MAG: beta-ketoacyl synthase N-terminal-like domain-containing protein, partial [Planctomycetota bacterium]|nr:beta-ketoacyl synthase N-terminal-like domain-containing protein [Planctomycetota bacterium]
MRRRVVITGMGSVNPLGHDVESTWKALLAGQSGASPMELFDAHAYPTKFAAQVKGYKLADHIANPADHVHAARHCTFALGAATEAWKQARLESCPTLDRDRLAIYLGCGE